MIDEFLYNATHDKVIDWLLPSVPPTGRKLSIPMLGVVNVRGDRLYHGKVFISSVRRNSDFYSISVRRTHLVGPRHRDGPSRDSPALRTVPARWREADAQAAGRRYRDGADAGGRDGWDE